jgi:hypothetical protein
VSQTTIVGNIIGTNAAGDTALSNSTSGILITETAANNTIGGVTDGSRNLISSNAIHGVRLFGMGVTSTTVAGNYIGTNIAGGAALGNNGDGVVIQDGPTGNTNPPKFDLQQ